MMKLLKRLALAVVAVFALVTIVSVSFLYRGGAFKDLQAEFGGTCAALPLAAGSAEDIEVDQASGIAYLSAYDRRAVVRGETVTGTILQLDLAADTATPAPALAQHPESFRPHGLSLVTASDGTLWLFVISHRTDTRHTIERFRWNLEDRLFYHVESIDDPLFNSPNDLVALGPDRLVVANDTGATNGFERVTEMLFGRALSSLVLYENGSARAVRSDMASVSGINADDRFVYVAETMANKVTALRRDDLTAAPSHTIALSSAPDNIDVAADGSLWVAAHANTLALIRHFTDPQQPAPSQVFRIDPVNFATEQVFLDLGETHSAGSVGVTYGKQLLLGSITEPQVLMCQLPD